ncbi:hypothetical protein [Cupriavidus pinatubonensis]|uniref:hypothetical protein n=1 Tax=Cupriavidus pinatubonensis TaxID=248026 RepID=UPI001CC4E12C|nr:hypothetical protein [Cupriavidus pinatubonensis]
MKHPLNEARIAPTTRILKSGFVKKSLKMLNRVLLPSAFVKALTAALLKTFLRHDRTATRSPGAKQCSRPAARRLTEARLTG